ncbi:hypothetical protein BH92_27100 (plasmid) [Rhodococcoides fascians A21d2]|nr:hypothetical protein [Rhodococcus fascians]QII03727.1 hypothetical protein BH92_27100 [Rhodococcus fascians A21d2]
MAQTLDHSQATPIVDWLEVIAKAAALGQISDTDPGDAPDSKERTR